MATKRTHLVVLQSADEPPPETWILEAGAAPAFIGDEDEDMLCGGCGEVVAAGVSARSIRTGLLALAPWLVRCACCGATSRLP